MAEQRLSRKEIRQPDQFVSLSVHVMTWTQAHLSLLLYGIGGVIVLIALLSGWSVWQKHRAQAAEKGLYAALKLLDAPAANRPQALEQLQKLVKDYGNTTAAATAYWHMGHLYFEKAEYAAALHAYRQAQQRFRTTTQPLLMAVVTLDVAYTQEASGACDPDAIASFEAVLPLPATWLRGEAYLGIGRCHETAGAPHKAIAVYDRALVDHNVPEAARQLISERLQLLKARTAGQG